MKHRRSSEDSAALEPITKKTAIGEKIICCFGMVIDLPLELAHDGDLQETPIPLRLLEDDRRVWALNSDTVFGHLDLNTTKIIQVLRKDLRLQLFAERNPLRDTSGVGRKLRHKNKTTEYPAPLKLFIVLYGPPCLFESVGLFASKCNLFLQHPKHCDHNVPYRNPHCLTSESLNDVYTFDLESSFDLDTMAAPTAFCNPIDLFANSTEEESLVECQSPCTLRTELYKHQKQALTFMLRREKGWALNGSLRDIWKKEDDSSGRLVYVNIISGQKQIKPPSDFRGGLLTDAPGLGKSLSIIALIASTRESQRTVLNDLFGSLAMIFPVIHAVIQMWRDELCRHLKWPDAIRTGVYYGKDRNKLLTELASYDLIITTYSVVRLDWKTSLSQSSDSFTLHGAKWGRIVLDEAHIIREPTKSFAKSICALQAECRWGLTGTPIQNRLTDLYSLFRFLRCSPFDDSKVFNAQVTQAWITRSDPNAVAKLKTLVNCLSLRRPKATIELPPRSDETFRLDFNNQEWEYYQRTRASTLNAVDPATGGVSFLNALHLVNELRLICNHGILNRKAVNEGDENTTVIPTWSDQKAQLGFDQLEQAGLATCSNPECLQDLTSALSSETGTQHLEEPGIVQSQEPELFCSSCFCFYDRIGRPQQIFKVCNHLPRCSSSNIAQSTQESKSSGLDWGADTPSKIQRLLEDLSATPDDVKSVVFSGWTKTFNIIQPRLMAKSIRCVRLDGTSSARDRAKVVRVFREDPGIKVLLATITCGGIGLDLTAASRAYIMEPQWNPMSELQALDRIHRLGQQREVKTIRYVMKGSWEEQVLTLQRRKQDLADLTLSGGAISRAELADWRLQYLRELVG